MRSLLLTLALLASGCGTIGWTSADPDQPSPATLAPVHSGPVAVRLEVRGFPEAGAESSRRIRWARSFIAAEPNGMFSVGNSRLWFDHEVEQRSLETLREILPAAERRTHYLGEPRVEMLVWRGIPRANRVINLVWSRLSYATLTIFPHWGRDHIVAQARLVDPSGAILAQVKAEAYYHQFTWALLFVPYAFLERDPRTNVRGAHATTIDAAIRRCVARLARHPAWQAPPQ